MTGPGRGPGSPGLALKQEVGSQCTAPVGRAGGSQNSRVKVERPSTGPAEEQGLSAAQAPQPRQERGHTLDSGHSRYRTGLPRKSYGKTEAFYKTPLETSKH